MAGTQLTKLRWALGINGVLSIVFGVVILIWPGISLFALTILFGAYATSTGIIGLGAVISGTVDPRRGWLVVSSLLDIAVGVTLNLDRDLGAGAAVCDRRTTPSEISSRLAIIRSAVVIPLPEEP
jgi:uncharacterized membrane protein HdeD (DUF308 family)